MFPGQAALGGAAAHNNAQRTRAAVGNTLRDITAMLAKMSESNFTY